MIKEQQIEEIAKNATNCNKHKNMTCVDCKIRGQYGCAAYEVSKQLVNNSYEKIKEFAEKLKLKVGREYIPQVAKIINQDIDELLKEYER